MRSVAEIAAELERRAPVAHRVAIEFDGWSAAVESNSAAVAGGLGDYLRMFAVDRDACDETVRAYQVEAPDWELGYRDWARAPGKSRKEQVADLDDGWVVRKVRTGMAFALGGGARLAVGPCLDHPNQIVNFVNALFISARLRGGWTLCHAAGVARGGVGVGIAGVSGAGKSTLALRALGRELAFVSNDRLLVNQSLDVVGVPKHPRINPGTALRDPALVSVLDPARAAELERMDPGALWALEDKHDVDIGERFGGRWTQRARLGGFVLLAWRRDSRAPTAARAIDLGSRPDLWPTLLKTPGPLYVGPGDRRGPNSLDVDPAPYLEILASVPVIEITGAVDFEAAADVVLELLS